MSRRVPLLGAERGEKLRGHASGHLVGVAQEVAARRGEGDDAAPAVAGSGAAFDEAEAFQVVDEAHDLARVVAELPAQLALGAPSTVAR